MTIPITVESLIKRLTPEGTHGEGDWSKCPKWPPDLFAITATLIETCGTYTRLVQPGSLLNNIREPLNQLILRGVGLQWRKSAEGSEVVDALWNRIYTSFDCELGSWKEDDAWCMAAHCLLCIADEASVGIGFFSEKESWVQAFQRMANISYPDSQREQLQPASCCIYVPSLIACVQPKTRTPQVGCSTRSLSHHLALLPPRTSVHVAWHPNDFNPGRSEDKNDDNVFNVLAIPFPYQISASSAECTRTEGKYGFFDFDQAWLPDDPAEIINHVKELITAAQKDVRKLHGIIFPELALDDKTYDALVQELLKWEYEGLEFLIAGVKSATMRRNMARTTNFVDLQDGSREEWQGVQFKHHRWRLDREQITNYSLGSVLDPAKLWWEDIDIDSRSLDFYVFRRGACFTTLICEDLARVDPCQEVIHSIGPNLVFALLMDGPQLSSRWSGRYAMTLADDPGSSVLSVSSLGLMNRSKELYGSSKDIVALWRDPSGGAREICLSKGHHGVVLTLTRHIWEELTLDGRGDNDAAYSWYLSGSMSVKNENCSFIVS